MILTTSAYADELKKIAQNLNKINSLSIEVEPIKSGNCSEVIEVDQHITGTISQLEDMKNPNLEVIKEEFFQKDSFYPDFCHELVSNQNIKRCFKKLKQSLKDADLSNAAFVKGNNNDDEFQYLFIQLKENEQTLNIKLIIQDER